MRNYPWVICILAVLIATAGWVGQAQSQQASSETFTLKPGHLSNLGGGRSSGSIFNLLGSSGNGAAPDQVQGETVVANTGFLAQLEIINLVLPGSDLVYAEMDPATPLDGAALVKWSGKTFADGTLAVELGQTGTGADQLVIAVEVGDQLSLGNGQILFSGTAVAVFTGGGDGSTPLLVTFNDQADQAAIQEIVRHVAYQNTSDTPDPEERVAQITLTTPSGLRATASKGITVSTVNDIPVLAINAGLSLEEGGGSPIGKAQLQATDADHANGQIIFTVQTAPVHGTLFASVIAEDRLSPMAQQQARRGPVELGEGATFSQEAIDAGGISYQHEGSEVATDSFVFVVADAAGAALDAAVFAIAVSQVNDAPVLDTKTQATLDAIVENDTNNIGTPIADILGSAVADPDPRALAGLALVGADNTNGQWQYTIDSGTTWTDLPAVMPMEALLLAAQDNTRLRFVPGLDYFGSATVQYRAWDLTVGANGAFGADASINGGRTPYSAEEATARIAVSRVDRDAGLTAGAVVVEPVPLPSTASREAPTAIFDFVLADGGTADGQGLEAHGIELQTGGGGPFEQVIFLLAGAGEELIEGIYSAMSLK